MIPPVVPHTGPAEDQASTGEETTMEYDAQERQRRLEEATDRALEAVGMLRNGSTIPAILSDIVTARETIRRSLAGTGADPETAACLIDATLQGIVRTMPAGTFTRRSIGAKSS